MSKERCQRRGVEAGGTLDGPSLPSQSSNDPDTRQFTKTLTCTRIHVQYSVLSHAHTHAAYSVMHSNVIKGEEGYER